MTLRIAQHDLVERCRRGDRNAQFALYHQYSTAMYNICLRMLYDRMEAEDALQNAFVDVFTKIDSFRGDSTIGAWIKRIVINTCINQIKKKKLLTSEWDEKYAEVPEEQESPEDYADLELVKSAIGQLPEGYRAVFTLYAMEGYDHKEIGQILGVTEATSKSQYARAKQKIREMVTESKNR